MKAYGIYDTDDISKFGFILHLKLEWANVLVLWWRSITVIRVYGQDFQTGHEDWCLGAQASGFSGGALGSSRCQAQWGWPAARPWEEPHSAHALASHCPPRDGQVGCSAWAAPWVGTGVVRSVDAREAIVASVSGSRGAQPLLSWGLVAGPSSVLLLPVSAAVSLGCSPAKRLFLELFLSNK